MKRYVLLGAFVLCGCAVGPDFRPPAAPDGASYSHESLPATTRAGGASQTLVAANHALPAWWTQFDSEALNHLVDTALQQSPTLGEARAKLIEARENYVAQAGATEFPSLDATLSGTRQKVNPAAFGVPNVPNPGPFTLLNASVSVSYALDVFGGNRRALEALLAQVDYQTYELDAARLTLAGNVVSTAIRRASLQQQLALTQQLADAQAQQLTIIEGRHAAGGVAQLDVHAQRTLLAQTQALLPPLATQLAAADHQLAILLGVEPAKADFNDVTLDTLHLPDTVPVTLPSTLARERPDIRASEALLHQASANVGVATANLYPQIKLTGSFSQQSITLGSLFDGKNDAFSLAGGITQPLFDFGRRRAQKRAAEAAMQASLANYEQTVLNAFRQVADVLAALEHDAQASEAQQRALEVAESSLALTRESYSAGNTGVLQILDAERQVQRARIGVARARAQRMQDTAELVVALGGDSPVEPATRVADGK